VGAFFASRSHFEREWSKAEAHCLQLFKLFLTHNTRNTQDKA